MDGRMKKILVLILVLILALFIATPCLAVQTSIKKDREIRYQYYLKTL